MKKFLFALTVALLSTSAASAQPCPFGICQPSGGVFRPFDRVAGAFMGNDVGPRRDFRFIPRPFQRFRERQTFRSRLLVK